MLERSRLHDRRGVRATALARSALERTRSLGTTKQNADLLAEIGVRSCVAYLATPA